MTFDEYAELEKRAEALQRIRDIERAARERMERDMTDRMHECRKRSEERGRM